jgi:hypothetical protein
MQRSPHSLVAFSLRRLAGSIRPVVMLVCVVLVVSLSSIALVLVAVVFGFVIILVVALFGVLVSLVLFCLTD